MAHRPTNLIEADLYRFHFANMARAVLREIGLPDQSDVSILHLRHTGSGDTVIEGVDGPLAEVPPNACRNVFARASELRSGAPAANLPRGGCMSQEGRFLLIGDSLFLALQEALDELDDAHSRRAFCSPPIMVGDLQNMRFVVLHVNRSSIDADGRASRLKSAFRPIDPRSLLEACIWECLRGWSDSIRRAAPHVPGDLVVRPVETVVREAASSVLDALVAKACGIDPMDATGPWTRPFEALDDLAYLQYEKTDAADRSVLFSSLTSTTVRAVRMSRPVPLGSGRLVRKLLVAAEGDLNLECDGQGILGWCRHVPAKSAEPAVVASFSGRGTWKVEYGGASVFSVSDRRITTAIDENPLPGLEAHIANIFPKDAEPREVASLVGAVAKAGTGGLIVVSEAAIDEVSRLQGSCIPLSPQRLDPESFASLSAIDGAVIVSPVGVCAGVGVVLDGVPVSERESPARGSRHNSAARYLARCNQQDLATIAIAISEDGGVTVLPDVLPPLSRETLATHVAAFEEAIGPQGNAREMFRELDWLDQHRLYLDAGVCSRLTSSMDCRREDGEAWGFDDVSFTPNPFIIPSYFVE